MTTDHDRLKAMADALESILEGADYYSTPEVKRGPVSDEWIAFRKKLRSAKLALENYRAQAEEPKYREPVLPAKALKALADQFPGWGRVTSGSTNREDMVWNKDKLAFEPVDSVNEYVDEYIMVIRRPITPDAR